MDLYTKEKLKETEKKIKRNKRIVALAVILCLIMVPFLLFSAGRCAQWYEGTSNDFGVKENGEVIYSGRNFKRVDGFDSTTFEYLGPVYIEMNY